MTTTVRVEARARGARVETNGEVIELGAHQDRTFQIQDGSQTFTVTQGEESQDRAAQMANEEVPGRAQNDELLSAGKRRATPPTGNQSGADETTTQS